MLPPEQMLSDLTKYDKFAGGIPDLGLYSGYLSADTQASFISNLRQVNSYTANGMLPTPTTFRHFGTAQMLSPISCSYLVQLQGSHFVTVNGSKETCGILVAVPGL